MNLTIVASQIAAPDMSDLEISDRALDLANMRFNPSGSEGVDRMKLLTAAIFAEIDSQCAGLVGNADALRELAIARTHIQSAAMFAVRAITR